MSAAHKRAVEPADPYAARVRGPVRSVGDEAGVVAGAAAAAAARIAAVSAVTAAATAAVRPRAAVVVERAVDLETAHRFWALYEETFGDLATRAVARQVLHYEEFMAAMIDPRVDKYVAYDDDGEAVAMCTLTNHLETVPWISPAYFAHHYPDQTARGVVYYLGFILVAHAHRGGHLFCEMVRELTWTVASRGGLCAYDMCAFNNDVVRLADATEALLSDLGSFDVAKIDTQHYYRALVPGGQPLAEMRSRFG